MNVERLIEMANDIADYFASEPDAAVGAAGVANHLKRFWDPSMRKQIVAHVRDDATALSPLALAGIRKLTELDQAA